MTSTNTASRSCSPLAATRFELAGDSHAGCVRSRNEDAFRVDPAHGLLVVADGVATCHDGARAAWLAVDAVVGFFEDPEATWPMGVAEDGAPHARRLEAAFRRAHERVREAARAERLSLSTTLVGAILHAGTLVVAHVGDSRVYLWRAGRLRRLTRDHNYAEDYPRSEPPRAAGIATLSHLLTRAVGFEAEVEVDTGSYALAKGDVVVLCSDGLPRCVADETVAARCAQGLGAAMLARALVEDALSAGAPDNVTVVVGLCLR